MKEDLEKTEPNNEKEVKGDAVNMLKSLQQENKKLAGQIQTLSAKKEELELACAQLAVPLILVPTSSWTKQNKSWSTGTRQNLGYKNGSRCSKTTEDVT